MFLIRGKPSHICITASNNMYVSDGFLVYSVQSVELTLS
jgi:hypothetical protein